MSHLIVQFDKFNGHDSVAMSCASSPVKAELNIFKYHLVPKMKLTLPIVQNICRIGQLKIGRE